MRIWIHFMALVTAARQAGVEKRAKKSKKICPGRQIVRPHGAWNSTYGNIMTHPD
jgi:hypothetical protein